MSKECSIQKKTSIGGQALIEGVMMRGPEKTAMAVRHTSGEIVMEEFENKKKNSKICKIPLVRGVINMVESLALGYKCLMRSAELAGLEEEDTDPNKPKSKGQDILMGVIMVISTVLGFGIAIALFIVLPTLLFNLTVEHGLGIDPEDPSLFVWRSVVEGVLKIALFVGYIAITSLMKDIRRTFQYHGAEHKSIFCYEAGLELTVENVKKQSRFHPRCGTSFLILMLIVGIVIGLCIPISHSVIRPIIKILTIPLMVGIGYELIKWAGRSDNWFTRAISKPGVWMQHLTTKEPTDDMIECAIASLKAVIPEDGDADQW